MDSIDYKKLYKLQDEILDIVFEIDDIFYLTGGTAISRFYYEKRYSDDLDFFVNNNDRFNTSVRRLKINIEKKYNVKVEVESKDFIRIKIDDFLQVDFVNDRVYRYEKSQLIGNYKIDNIKNILANKLTAVIGRDNPKDIFDIYLISKFNSFSWREILEIAHKKAGFSSEDLVIRLSTFPTSLLKSIKLIDKDFLDNFEVEYKVIIEEIKEYLEHK
jgi:predicted nucleotidyltransferase component of viral defense system